MSGELVETVAAQVVAPTMGREDAEKLDRRIRNLAGATKGQLDSLGALVAGAKAGRIHEALDYPSWTAYVGDALRELCSGEGIEIRRELGAYLYDAGMSQRAIAAATGASKTTVHRDLEFAKSEVVHNGPPNADAESEEVATGLDETETKAANSADPPESVPAEVDASGPAKAKTTTGLDGKSHPRERKKRPKGQGQQKKPKIPEQQNHAKGLTALLEKNLDPAAYALENLIPNKLNESVRPEIATELADRFERDMATFTRIHRLLTDRSSSSTTE